MRIIPYELLHYAPDASLTALRKELAMYDFALNKNLSNIAMQHFLDLKRNYFNLIMSKWVLEMNERNHYVNSLFSCYVKHNSYEIIITPPILIIECCMQWDLKGFIPYHTKKSWYEIICILLPKQICISQKQYQVFSLWYKDTFMRPNKKGLLKPQKLNMTHVINYFNTL